MTLLRLNSNEGPPVSSSLLTELATRDSELLRRYSDASALETVLGDRFGVGPERVLVTAGADEALDRVCRAYAGPERAVLLPEPTFDMLERFAALAGAPVVRIPWRDDAFPVDAVLSNTNERTGIIVVVSPNNPTGAVASLDDVRRMAAAAPQAMVLIDHAYVEYADEDLTTAVLDLDNVVVVRTMSKAWGLAGCRVGYAVGAQRAIALLRAAGAPYPVAAPSIALALAQLCGGEAAMQRHVERVREERIALRALLTRLGVGSRVSQANFVLVDFGRRMRAVREGLNERGIIVREFPGRPGLAGNLRITLPGDLSDFRRLTAALEALLE